MTTQTRVPIRRISLDEAKRRMRDLLFVDTRSAAALHRNPYRVPGAVQIPIKELDQRVKQLPHDRTLVTYCT